MKLGGKLSHCLFLLDILCKMRAAGRVLCPASCLPLAQCLALLPAVARARELLLRFKTSLGFGVEGSNGQRKSLNTPCV